MNEKAFKRALIILDAYLNEQLPEELMRKIHNWLAEDEHGEEKQAALQELWDKGFGPKDSPDATALRSFEQLSKTLNLPEVDNERYRQLVQEFYKQTIAPEPEKKRYLFAERRTLVRIVAVAASVAVLVGTPWLWFSRPQPAAPMMAMVTMSVPDTLGAQGRIELPDGSDIFIRPGSAISYARDFGTGNKRRVVLDSGEVYLKVAKDSTRPFVVETGKLNVNVLGTRFNVVVLPGSAQTLVTLYEGKIEVEGFTGTDGQTVVGMTPGQNLVYNNSTDRYAIEQVTDCIPDWIEQRLIFKDATYSEIFRAIEWYYGVKIETKGHFEEVTKLNFRFTGCEDISTAIWVLHNVSREFEYEISGNTVRMKAQNKNL